METVIKTASVRIALSHNYSTFEIALNIENDNGISQDDLKKARRDCQLLATDALNEYKTLPSQDAKIELGRVKNKIAEIEKLVTKKEPEIADQKEIEKVEAMPLYSEVKKPTKESKK